MLCPERCQCVPNRCPDRVEGRGEWLDGRTEWRKDGRTTRAPRTSYSSLRTVIGSTPTARWAGIALAAAATTPSKTTVAPNVVGSVALTPTTERAVGISEAGSTDVRITIVMKGDAT